ncbi:GNAT family N-acetyltransferase [Microbulbifer sp. JMSA004]|uniref:GNAT family N-acetyltransferase n=1 Tax=Microbulbifer sp. JMSA004 TaxID=3243370 RepID=UPI0040393407
MVTVCPLGHNNTLKPLFDKNTPNKAILDAVFNGTITGRAYVDTEKSPAQAILVSDFLKCAFISTNCTTEFLVQFSALHLSNGLEYIFTHEYLFFELEKYLDISIRKEFIRDPLKPIPISGRIASIPSIEQFYSAQWKDIFTPCCGDFNTFISNHIAIYEIRHGIIVSEGYAICGENIAELGAISHAEFRGQGGATTTCSHILSFCKKNNLTPVWTCRADNSASIATAYRLGFEHHRDYMFARWQRS